MLRSRRNPDVRSLLPLLFACVASAAVARPAGEAALELAAEGRCEAAVEGLERLHAADPDDPATAGALGRCRIRLGDPAGAVIALSRARSAAPRDADLAIDLAIAAYHQGDLALAATNLADARDLGASRPEQPLYEGLLALARGESASAADLFANARSADEALVEPVASFYEGVAQATSRRETEAREAFARVIRDWPGSEWAAAAERELAKPSGRPAPWASLRLGLEWDDNPVLRGRGVRVPEEISGDSDFRLAWHAQAGASLIETDPWRVATSLSFQGAEYAELEDFDVLYPQASVWVDRSLAAGWTARARGSYAYGWVGGEPFVSNSLAEFSLLRSAGEHGTTRLSTEFAHDNYRFARADVVDALASGACAAGVSTCSPIGSDESRARNRDGNGYQLGLEHELPLSQGNAELLAGYRFRHFSARGSEYSFDAHELRVGARAALPAEFSLLVTASYVYRPYRHATSYPEPDQIPLGSVYPLRSRDRRERELRGEVAISRPLTDRIVGELRWSIQDNHSNAAVFDFDRQRVGAYVSVGFGG